MKHYDAPTLVQQVLKMWTAESSNTMCIPYIFCLEFRNDWQMYTAYGPGWTFLFQILHRAIDFPWNNPSTYPQNRSWCSTQHPTPQADYCEVYTSLLLQNVFSRNTLAMKKRESTALSRVCISEGLCLTKHMHTHTLFLIWNYLTLLIPGHTVSPRLLRCKADGAVKSLTWNVQTTGKYWCFNPEFHYVWYSPGQRVAGVLWVYLFNGKQCYSKELNCPTQNAVLLCR